MVTGRIKEGYGTIQRDVMTMNISIYAKSVYCLFISYAGNKSVCYPSIATICDNLSISKNTVLKAIKELLSVKLLRVEHKISDQGIFGNNVYYPLMLLEIMGGGSSPGEPGGSSPGEPGVVHEVNPKKEHIKNNNINIPEASSGKIKPRIITEKSSLHCRMISLWFDDINPEWIFSPIDAKKIQSLIEKIKKLFKKHARSDGDDDVITFFRLMCENLPEFYRGKELKLIESDFNTIVEHLKKNKNENNRQTTTANQYADTKAAFGIY